MFPGRIVRLEEGIIRPPSRKAQGKSTTGPAAVAAAPPDDDASDRVAERPKQAIVIVHGMGEQRPMDTLRGFVKAVWSLDTDLTEPEKVGKRKPDPEEIAAGVDESKARKINKTWIVPDPVTKSFELRRITTPNDINGRSSDFYELYWSDITQGTAVERLWGWVKGLLLRKPSDIPRGVVPLYLLLAVVTALLVLPPLILAVLKALDMTSFVGVPLVVWAVVAAIIGVIIKMILPYLGDVAIYVEARPETISKRREARERGLELLEELSRDDRYDRIVLVAHSLGSILAYDLLQIHWTTHAPASTNPWPKPTFFKGFTKVEKSALKIGRTDREKQDMSGDVRAEWRALQWSNYVSLRTPPAAKPGERLLPWKVSDFVTIGSPLAHAEFLVTRNREAFEQAIEERLLSTCPPVSERKNGTILFPYDAKASEPRYPHHASVFAATRWTNIYDKGNGWLTGDPISGDMQRNFGPGIENVRVRMTGRFWRIFTHTAYWDSATRGHEVGTARTHLDVLRDAVDLRRKLEPVPPP